MKRSVYDKLLEWKNRTTRKPLVLNGARQVGKTWILKEFGNSEYDNLVYINCDNNPAVKGLFVDFDITRIIRGLSAISEQRIEKKNTLIVLDEVQEVPLGLTALKYFYEDAPEYHVIVAGSLLGIGLHQGTGFPVGKIEELNMFPLSFEEFTEAIGQNFLLEDMRTRNWGASSALNSKYIEVLRQYYYIGGMPEVVEYYSRTQDVIGSRSIQKRILEDYRRDFSKHIPGSLLAKVNMVWDSIPSQLSKENKKFIYGVIKSGGRAKEFEEAIQWLSDAGLIRKVNRINKLEKPLKFYEDFNAFKLFMHDLGLLGAMADVAPKDVLLGNNVFTEYKGAFTEQYVEQQLTACGVKHYYYTNSNSTLEMDFVIQNNKVIPIEVKAEENLKSKSMKSVLASGDDLIGWRFSMQNYKEQERLINVPLYLVQEWLEANSECYNV